MLPVDPSDSLPCLQRIQAAYPFRSRSFNKLAEYLHAHLSEVAFLTAAQLAHATNVDVGTVIRFAQRLGYRGYPALQAEIRQYVRRLLAYHAPAPSPLHGRLQALVRSLLHTGHAISPEQVQSWQQLLMTARRVHLVYHPPLHTPAGRLQQVLESHHIAVQGWLPDTLLNSLDAILPGDLVLILEDSPQAPSLAQVIQHSRERGATTAAIAAGPTSPCAQQAQYSLSARSADSPALALLLVTALALGLTEALTHFPTPEVGYEIDPLSTA